ncbi:hypothetical protein BFP71_03725 [Roseivirga misakiensis]|uniref:Polysaccharide biosynthesis protein C-terminal domain-containing protein n=1 Tax=Roseivirga misakiensis TaxID=1563681 RepID=A0A1E5T7B5_9BACT|nr:hypothetical protein BFP71_03725 [Roseivirga misakiensis]
MLNTLFFNADQRSAKARINIVGLFGLQGLNSLISFIQVPLVLNYLDDERYGIWITLSVILGWFSLFNVGLGNGLRNRLTEAIARNDIQKARIYVSTTYVTLGLIFAGVFLLFLGANFFLDWASILNASSFLSEELGKLALTVFFFLCAKFVVGLIESIAYAKQEPALAQGLSVTGRLLALLGIYLLLNFAESRLLYLGAILAGVPVFISLTLSIIIFRTRYKQLRPTFMLVRFSELGFLMNLGIKFFVVQIAAIVFYQTNNFILTRLFGPTEVTPYSVAFQYFSIATLGFAIILSPYWSAITEAFVKNELGWIKKTISKLKLTWLLLLLLIAGLFVFSDRLIPLWVGKELFIEKGLIISLAVYVSLNTFNNIFNAFLNGVGKLVVQMYRLTIMTILYIPLTLFFCDRFGISGIMYSMVIFEIVGVVVYQIQYQKIMNSTAKGIWNR